MTLRLMYNKIVNSALNLFLIFSILFFSQKTNAQSYVTWNSAYSTTGLSGTFPGGTVSVSQNGVGNPVSLTSPEEYGGDVLVSGNQTFSTFGPNSSSPSKSLTFTFSTPVIVTKYNMSDIDMGSSWNDTFVFSGITFSSANSVYCSATTTGVAATTDVGSNSEYARWINSTVPVTSFTINFSVTAGLTHAYLAYSLEVLIPSAGASATVNNPTVCTGQSAAVTATPASPGSYSYVWTVPSGVANPGNVSSFSTPTAGTYSVVITNLTTGDISTSSSGTVTINPFVTTTFTPIAPICQGDSVNLPTTSNNGVIGTWSPLINNSQTTTYTFTPTGNPCASSETMTIVVNPQITPAFTQVAAICEGTTLSNLPATSNNGITGTWSPALNNTQTTTYTFTPNGGICINSATMTIVVNPVLTPTFTQITPTCYGSPIVLLSISNNNVGGIWSPAIDNTATTTYTFTPNPAECAVPSTMTVAVLNDFNFEIADGCENNSFILHVVPTGSSFDVNTASFNWQNNTISVGTNSSSFNVTNYLSSTTQTETLPISFDITVTNSDGCEKTKTIALDNIYCGIQKGISPNNDNLNDFFDLRLLGVRHLSIFNRYGTKVYDKENYTCEWYGKTNTGNALPTGTYYYLIEFINNSDSKTGWIYINEEI